MDTLALKESARKQLVPSFSVHHARLVAICFDPQAVPSLSTVQELSVDRLEPIDLQRLSHMVQVEFAASLAKEKTGDDNTTIAKIPEPNPYDVFLMTTTMEQPKTHIAVCLPTRRNGPLMWYNGSDELIPLPWLERKWKIGSLSGVARVLEALSSPATTLTKWAMDRSMLAEPVPLDQVDPSMTRHLNDSQRRAVATVASPTFTEGFLAIQGPPGCGKTTTMVEMVTVAATAENRYTVLVTAPSNTAVANIALKLFATGRFHHGEVVVFGENCDPSVHFLSPKQRGRKFALLCKEREMCADPDIRERLRQEFVRWLQCAGDETFSMSALASMCPVITDDETGRKTAKENLSSTRIVCSTLNSAGSGFLRSALDVRTFMLDEAGQAHEAEFYIATSYPGLKRIILVGDPQQLPATVISPPCQAAGLGKSWLEKVQHVDADALHLLDTQYRMDPNILAFPNKTFYRGRIKTGDKVLDRDQLVRAPFLFVDTARRGKEEKEDFSFRNAYEATVIKSLITTDKDIRRILHNDGSARIMVIAPYRAQVKLLTAILSTLRLSSLDVGTVDSCQGQEAEIVIVSTVRTKSAGFVDSPARLNVALTRAKMVLRVVGDATFFGGLVSSSTLRRLCAHAEAHNVIEATNIRSDPWSAPAWHQETVWLPIANTRFCTRIQELSARDKNLCLNTLFAVAKPDPVALGGHIPNKKEPGWYLSYLKINRGLLCIVWVAKEGATKPIAEAHFAGSRDECLRFTQMNSTVPFGSRVAQKDMSGLRPLVEADGRSNLCGRIGQQPLVAWPVTDSIQKAILSNTALPDGIVQLDPYQERVARSPPPLLIESRSGTGKTLVLLQHVAYHSSRVFSHGIASTLSTIEAKV